MCLLTYFEPGVQPDTQALHYGATTNDDGHGWAIVHDGRIITGRSMNAEESIYSFELARSAYPEGPAMFHSRWGTHGITDTSNVHPFNVDRDPRTVIAHNGVLPSVVHPRKGDPRSDTRILADGMSGRFGSLRKPKNRAALAAWMGRGNKIVILTVNRRFGGNAFILNEDQGIWTPEGIWYSNDGYLAPVKRYTYGSLMGGSLRWDNATQTWFRTDTDGTVLGPRTDSTPEWWEVPCITCGEPYIDCACPYVRASKEAPVANDGDTPAERDRKRAAYMALGDTECYTCKDPKRYCRCPGGENRCNGCYYWLINADREAGFCGICRTCVDCGQWPEACDCYIPESARRDGDLVSIAQKALTATPHGEYGYEGS